MVDITWVVGISIGLVVLYNYFVGGSKKTPRKQFGVIKREDINGDPVVRNWRTVDKFQELHQNFTSIHDAFQTIRKKYETKPFLGHRNLIETVHEEHVVRGEKKNWEYAKLSNYKWETYEQVGKRIDNFGSGLLKLGLKPSDNLAIYSETRKEWTIAAFGAIRQNIVVLTIYANLGHDPMIFALNEGEVKYLVANGNLIKSLVTVKKKVESLKTIIYTDKIEDEASKKELESLGVTLIQYSLVEELGEKHPAPATSGRDDDTAVIMYTSGSTGNPKGVLISHKNIIAAITNITGVVSITDQDIHLSYLPLAHILAFVVECGIMINGGSIGYGSPRTLSDSAVRGCKGDITELRPTVLVGVPSVYDKIKSGIQAKISKLPAPLRWLFNLGYNIRKNAFREGKKTPLLDLAMFAKFKQGTGGRVRVMVSGGAPLSRQCAEYLYVCLGIPILQGYGLTETTGSGCIMEIDSLDIRASTVGAPGTCAEVKLVSCPEKGYSTKDDKKKPKGEIWLRGPYVSKGYYKNAKQTEESFTKDGWFKTGDIGKLHPNGTIAITDRVKNLIKPPHGEYIAVERLESIYKNSPLVENIMVYASPDHNPLIALVHPKNTTDKNAVLKSLADVHKSNNLKNMERISDVILYPEEWTPNNGWLTAAMKLRRSEIQKEHKKEIDEVYEKLGE